MGYLFPLDPPASVAALLLCALIYVVARVQHRALGKLLRATAVAIIALSAYLAWFKLAPRLIPLFSSSDSVTPIIVPLGISYYTFKLIHYLIESSRGNLPKHGFGDYLSYLLLFPTFTAGPIELFDHYLEHRSDRWSWDYLLDGATRILYGLIKRFVLVELVLIPMWGELSDAPIIVDQLNQLWFFDVWKFLIIAYLVAYLDFSAYSDIAIGASRLFGLRIAENFSWPILATDISSFWQRWHMSLAGWCQRYVYMPMIGLTRNPIAASYVTFTVMGLWHAGAFHWIAWGLYHATGIVVYQRYRRWRGRLKQPPSLAYLSLCRLGTFLFVSGGYAFTSGHDKISIVDSGRILAHALGMFFV